MAFSLLSCVAPHCPQQAVAARNLKCAQSVMDAGFLAPIKAQLEMFENSVRESAVKTVNTLVCSGGELAQVGCGRWDADVVARLAGWGLGACILPGIPC